MYNKITLIGNLGSDPEIRYMPSGDACTTFSVATNRRYRTRDGEERDETQWYRVEVWGGQAEPCNQYLEKGRLVYVEGSHSNREWQGQDGVMRTSSEVRANVVKFLSGNGQQTESESEQAAAPAQSAQTQAERPAAAAAETAPVSDDPPDDLPW